MSEDVHQPAVDLRTLLGEMAALRAEVRKQTEASRALSARVRDAGSQAPAAPADDAAALRVIIDLIDRIEAARLSTQAPAPRRWFQRPDPRVAALAEGLALTHARALSDLAALGVHRVDTAGAFDPASMEALDVIDGAPAGQVAREILGGYRRGDTLLRAAQVAVFRAPKEAE